MHPAWAEPEVPAGRGFIDRGSSPCLGVSHSGARSWGQELRAPHGAPGAGARLPTPGTLLRAARQAVPAAPAARSTRRGTGQQQPHVPPLHPALGDGTWSRSCQPTALPCPVCHGHDWGHGPGRQCHAQPLPLSPRPDGSMDSTRLSSAGAWETPDPHSEAMAWAGDAASQALLHCASAAPSPRELTRPPCPVRAHHQRSGAEGTGRGHLVRPTVSHAPCERAHLAAAAGTGKRAVGAGSCLGVPRAGRVGPNGAGLEPGPTGAGVRCQPCSRPCAGSSRTGARARAGPVGLRVR